MHQNWVPCKKGYRLKPLLSWSRFCSVSTYWWETCLWKQTRRRFLAELGYDLETPALDFSHEDTVCFQRSAGSLPPSGHHGSPCTTGWEHTWSWAAIGPPASSCSSWCTLDKRKPIWRKEFEKVLTFDFWHFWPDFLPFGFWVLSVRIERA